jgi:Uma2 family endonuclease
MNTTLEMPRVEPADDLPDGYERVHNELIEVDGMSIYSGLVATELVVELGMHVRQRKLGRVTGECYFILPLPEDGSRVRKPDVGFVSFERWPASKAIPYRGNPLPAVPDLAVEVASPTDLFDELFTKAREYLRSGVRLVWIVCPLDKTILAMGPNGAARYYTENETLDGGEVLPGFAITVGSIFPPRDVG